MSRIQPRTLKGFRDFPPAAMIPREGIIETARRVYEQGLAFKDAGTWSYSHLLEGRLANLENFSATAHEDDELKGAGWIWASQVQCAVCHTH